MKINKRYLTVIACGTFLLSIIGQSSAVKAAGTSATGTAAVTFIDTGKLSFSNAPNFDFGVRNVYADDTGDYGLYLNHLSSAPTLDSTNDNSRSVIVDDTRSANVTGWNVSVKMGGFTNSEASAVPTDDITMNLDTSSDKTELTDLSSPATSPASLGLSATSATLIPGSSESHQIMAWTPPSASSPAIPKAALYFKTKDSAVLNFPLAQRALGTNNSREIYTSTLEWTLSRVGSTPTA